MAITPAKLIAGSQLTTAAATYYTAPANTKAIIHNMTIMNNTSGALTFTVHIVNSGASESASNMVISARTIAAGETYTCPEVVGKVLSATGTIRALASAGTSVSIMADGVEIA